MTASDTYLFLPLFDGIMITIKIIQLVIIRVLYHFAVIGTIRFQLKICYYFHAIIRILTNLSVLYFFHNFCHITRIYLILVSFCR